MSTFVINETNDFSASFDQKVLCMYEFIATTNLQMEKFVY